MRLRCCSEFKGSNAVLVPQPSHEPSPWPRLSGPPLSLRSFEDGSNISGTQNRTTRRVCCCALRQAVPTKIWSSCLLLWTALMHEEAGGSGCAANLTVDVLAKVLQHVPQRHRLSQCALVCSAWAAAAAQATVHVEACQLSLKKMPAFDNWLGTYAGQIVSLYVDKRSCEGLFYSEYVLHMPLDKLTKLQELYVGGFRLDLPGEQDEDCSSAGTVSEDSGNVGAGPAANTPLPSLQELTLETVELQGFSSLLQLTKAPQLSTLSLEGIAFAGLRSMVYSAAQEGQLLEGQLLEQVLCSVLQQERQLLEQVLCSVLQQVPLLSLLRLPDFPFSDAAAQQTTDMQQLQQLELCNFGRVPLGNLQHLPSGITKLDLHGNDDFHSPIPPQELPQLSGLLELYLRAGAVLPQALSCFTQLQLLWVGNSRPLVGDGSSLEEGTAALLQALASLTSLRELRFFSTSLSTPSTDPQLCSALTASSHLTALWLNDAPIPKGAVQHMFASSKRLPFLQHLAIKAQPADDANDWGLDDFGMSCISSCCPCLDSADISCISSCCPCLERLDITNSSVQPGADSYVLQNLPHTCTKLWVGGAAFTDAAVDALVQLTQIKELHWRYSPQFTDVGLEQLTRLDLSRLYVYKCGLTDVLLSKYRTLDLTSNLQLGSVSKQLDALCDLSPVLALAPARLERRLQEDAAAVIEHLGQEMSSLQPVPCSLTWFNTVD